MSYDADASLPQMLLMFGFGFFILITVRSVLYSSTHYYLCDCNILKLDSERAFVCVV